MHALTHIHTHQPFTLAHPTGAAGCLLGLAAAGRRPRAAAPGPGPPLRGPADGVDGGAARQARAAHPAAGDPGAPGAMMIGLMTGVMTRGMMVGWRSCTPGMPSSLCSRHPRHSRSVRAHVLGLMLRTLGWAGEVCVSAGCLRGCVEQLEWGVKEGVEQLLEGWLGSSKALYSLQRGPGAALLPFGVDQLAGSGVCDEGGGRRCGTCG